MKIIQLVLAMLVLMFMQTATAQVTQGDAMKTITMQILSGDAVNYDESTRRVGRIELPDRELFTIERPWIPNIDAPDGVGGGVPFESAVPKGEYELVLRDSPSKGQQWHFVNPELHVFLEAQDREEEWQRYSCMFHIANFVEDVVGCAGVGSRIHGFGDRGIGVASSGYGISQLKRYLQSEQSAELVII